MVAGVIACDEPMAEALRPVRAVTGAVLHPLGAYLLHRGLLTPPIRVRAQQASAARLVEWLVGHPAVRTVHYPGLDGDPRSLLTRQLRGTGAMVSIDLLGGAAAAEVLTSTVRLFTHAVSLGGVDSLIQSPAALTHRPVPAAVRPAAGVVRLSIGLEDVDDLMVDLDRGLAAALDAAAPHRRVLVGAGC